MMTFIPRGISASRVHDLIEPQDTFANAGGVLALGKRIRQGEVLVQHKHKYEHLSILAAGTIILELDGKTQTLVGPTCITVPAGKHHGVKALTDAFWYCIHAEEQDGEVVDADDLTEARAMLARLKGM